jgi:ribosome maturation factor RimP
MGAVDPLPLRERLIALLEPLITALGFELVDVEWAGGPRDGTVRVFIDLPESAQRHVGVEDCEQVSREVSALFDADDPIPGRYALEVSSPGFDRLLRKPAHFARFVGQRIKLELAVARDGRRRYTGDLLAARADGIELMVDGQKVEVPFAEIGKARLAM